MNKFCVCGHSLFFHAYEFFCVFRIDKFELCHCQKFEWIGEHETTKKIIEDWIP